MISSVGVVCGVCDSFNAMGATSCAVCCSNLSLYQEKQTQEAPKPFNSEDRIKRPLVEKRLEEKEEITTWAMPAYSSKGIDRSGLAVITTAVKGDANFENSRAAKQVSRWTSSPTSTSEEQRDKEETATVKRVESASFPDQLTHEELMEQARNYLCWQCYASVPTGHKFCGRCGAEVPNEIAALRTMFFSDMQNPTRARLILIRGEGMDGLSFHLKMEQHLVGRKGNIEFADDAFVSPRHANFFYRDNKLSVRDEGSLNGVYVRVRGSVELSPGDTFLAGEQLFRLDPMPNLNDGPDPDGTYFYSSPKYLSRFRIVQILHGGALGMTVCARGTSLQLGREGGDLNFPADIYMSSSHCRVEEANGKFTLTDLNSRNGTYVRMKAEKELGHGDYLFIGRKLMRVELNS